MAGLLARLIAPFRRSAEEGAYRPGPYLLDGGWLSAQAGRYMNWWQMGYSLENGRDGSAMVEACISAYSQTAAMCATEGNHWRRPESGGRDRVTTSDLSRILRRPNDYQSISDFVLNLTRRLYSKGEAFALAARNSRNEIVELHLMENGYPLIAEDGSIFYWLSGNEVAERRFILSVPTPARDVLHVRLHTPRGGSPLRGASPILAAALDLAMSGAALSQQIAFYINQARPSFMLETDQKLTKEQASELRALWHEQTQGGNAGGTPILSWGLKAKEVSKTAKDGELADLLKMTDQSVALAFRMPLQVLGIGSTMPGSTEQLMQSWIATGLGFCLNHIEEAFGLLFRLRGYPDEYLEFDTKALLRSSFKETIDALSAGTRRVMTSNEARQLLDLPPKPGGDELLVQMQDIPMSLAGTVKSGGSPSSSPSEPPAPDADSDPEEDADAKLFDVDVTREFNDRYRQQVSRPH